MTQLQTKFVADTWIVGTWDEDLQLIEDPVYEKPKGYDHNGQYRNFMGDHLF